MNTFSLTTKIRQFLSTSALLFVLFVSNADAALPTVLDSAVNPGNGHLYYLLSNSTWTDAQTAAIGLGGNLTTINDLAENNWVWNRWATNRDLWIGLQDPVTGDGTGAAHAANFRWIDGDTSAYRNWRPGEPNNSDGNSYYTYILAKGLVAEGGAWNDVSNLTVNGSEPALFGVVEIIPEPSTACLMLLVGGILTASRLKKFPFAR